MLAPLSIPYRAIQTLPINEIFKPAEGGVDAGIEGLNVIEKSLADISNILAGENKAVPLFVIIGVFHIEEDGQFKQDARVLDNLLAEDSLFSGVGGS